MDILRLITWDESKALLLFVCVLGLACLGLIQFLKEISIFKCWKKRLLTIIVCVVILLLNTSLVPPGLSYFVTTLCLLLSLIKLGYQAFVEGIPHLITGKLKQLSGDK